MVKEKVIESLNHQLNSELYSSYLYLSMAAFFENDNFSGFSHWMKVQSQEEYGHAMKFYGYILEVGGKVNLQKIDAPKDTWKSVQNIFEETLKHEQAVTKSIYDIVDLTISEKDHATNIFLQWFVTEQVEEESTADKILNKVKMVGDSKNGLFLLDRELGMRAGH